MGYSITQQGDAVDYGVIECVADTVADVELLPTKWAPGSSCLVIADSSVYMLGVDKIWHPI